jgi:Zn-dependent protease with chaperone function
MRRALLKFFAVVVFIAALIFVLRHADSETWVGIVLLLLIFLGLPLALFSISDVLRALPFRGFAGRAWPLHIGAIFAALLGAFFGRLATLSEHPQAELHQWFPLIFPAILYSIVPLFHLPFALWNLLRKIAEKYISELWRFSLKTLVVALLALFVIPAYTLHIAQQGEARFFRMLSSAALTDQDGNVITRPDALADICALPENPHATPEAAKLKARLCASHDRFWQIRWVRALAFCALAGGAALLPGILLLGALAFANRRLRLMSFRVGRRLMVCATTTTVMLQGAMCLWFSISLAYDAPRFNPIPLFFGIVALLSVIMIVRAIFCKPEMQDEIEGALIPEHDAPHLWQRIRQIAAQLKTAPPEHLIAGIDADFHVSEIPVSVGGEKLQGRALFVSLPLLRILETAEADAVLAHELAHFAGGDTDDSARLWPQLAQYDAYLERVAAHDLLAAYFAGHLLLLYRLIFEFALARDRRAREYQADNMAARLVSPQAIIGSLIKTRAYAMYRAEMEIELFSRHEQLDAQLGLAARIAEGLRPWAELPESVAAMSRADISHPFDSHPALDERMKNVECVIPETRFAAIITQPPASTWAAEIKTAEQVEAELWSAYEKEFLQAHEENLSYRYNPADEKERELVFQHFPPARFELAAGRQLEINCEAIVTPNGETVTYAAIKELKIAKGLLGRTLKLTLTEEGWFSNKKIKIRLQGLKTLPALDETLQHYWFRHQAMREYLQRDRPEPVCDLLSNRAGNAK